MANQSAGGGTPQMATNGMSMGGQQPNVYQQASGAYNSALGGTQAAMGQAMGTPAAQAQASSYNAATMGPAGQLATTNLDPYMNPYQSQVIDQTAADMERARLIQQNQADDSMMQAGAFGGSRHGIANAETNRNYYDQLGATIGGLQHQGYTNAQNAAMGDINNQMTVDQANQQAMNAARAANAAMGTQTSLSNASMQNSANQSRFGNMLSAAGQMSGLADQGMRFGNDISDRQMRDGSITQGMQQAIIDAGKNQFSQFTNAGNLGLGPLAQFTSGNYGSSTTQKTNPGLTGILSALSGFA